MSFYRSIPKRRSAGLWQEEEPMLEGRTVLESEPVETMLLDKDGHPIWRMKGPIGFTALKERG